jgi:hypothetical protein
MADKDESHQDHTLDAIAAVAHQGEKYFLNISLGIFIAIVLVFGFLLVRQINQLPELADVPIAVFLPSKDQGSAQENARRQLEGFYLAYSDNDLIQPENQQKDQRFYQFHYPMNQGASEALDECDLEAIANLAEKSGFSATLRRIKCWNSPFKYGHCDQDYVTKLAEKNDTAAIIQKMKCWYHNDGVRVFIITMSGAVKLVRPKFIAWADTLDPEDRPILLATVVSAPDVADSAKTVFRHYIRSRDESDTLATYIESINPAPSRIGIIHVNDQYGISAKELLKTRLERNTTVGAYIVPFGQPEPGVRDDFDKFIADNNELVVVIGYGSMIEVTLDRLKALAGFRGPILLVSTFTEENWRPEPDTASNCFWDRIHYVGPITDKEETNSEWRGVVFQFSYLTLDRALICRDQRGVEKFWSCFTDDGKLKNPALKWNPHIEFTRYGDSHVSLGIFKLIDDETISAACRAGDQPD